MTGEAKVIEAVVQVGERETSYLCRGRGRPAVVVLAAAEATRLRLMGTLETAGRVVAPRPEPEERAATEAAIVEWLLDIVDCLGLDSPAIVLAPDMARVTAALRRAGAEGLGRVVVANGDDAALLRAVGV